MLSVTLAVKVVKTTPSLMTTVSQYVTSNWLYIVIALTVILMIPFIFQFSTLFVGTQQRQEQAVVALIRAEEMIKRGNAAAAVTHLTQAIEKAKNPQIQARAYDNRGIAYRMQKQFDLAIADHSSALSAFELRIPPTIQLSPEFHDDSQETKNFRKSQFYYNRGVTYDAKAAATSDPEQKKSFTELALADYRFAAALDASLSFVSNIVASRELRTRLGMAQPSAGTGTATPKTKKTTPQSEPQPEAEAEAQVEPQHENQEAEGIPSPRLPAIRQTVTPSSPTATPVADTPTQETSSGSSSARKKKAKRAD